MLDTQIDEGMLRERLMARLSAIFGGVALLLAVVGLYGVMSYSVASRRAEIGVRVALGATRSRILRMVLSDVGRMMIGGLAAGTVLALMASRAVGSLLYGLEPNDPATLMLSAALLAGGRPVVGRMCRPSARPASTRCGRCAKTSRRCFSCPASGGVGLYCGP